ncbi:u3 small nucleolar ribonucleoprotein protein MPP10 [Trichonephila inaurata madagascariensis]|uniref:U3 small nucleolar ribonucleoprotein protein MPP10 n=1 Tax=Trichonephila inaurata madagascariensis TaxID=2747483 RepID=A0A8X7CGB0_9ARAC|nr:u3 small nucleolar ribonucleoprotein protein MPP10 [Trichonephila inaurata madagascariensis]
MDAAMSDSMYQKYYEEFKNLTKNSEEFLQQNSTNSEEFLHIAKFFHDHVIQCNSLTALKSKSLPRLLIKGFDDEQILQQLEIQNKSAFSHFDSELSKFDLETLSFNANSPTENDFDDALPVSEEEANGASESEEHDDEDLVSDDDSEDNMESNNANLESNACKNKKREIEESESDPEDRIESNKRQKKSKKSGYKSIVDDQFFKLSNLEQFLRLEDLKEEKARDGELDESDEDEEIDLFQDIPSDYMDESDNENKKSSIDLMYEDFFDAPDSGDDENVENSDKMLDVEKEKYNYNKNYTNQGESENDDDELQENETNIPSKKTPFELQKENINKTIAEYEESMVKPKPWQLTGEVDKRNRPRDGLLDVQTDFVINEKPAIVQDAEFCEKIEKLIKMTKKNKAYSDGVRKEKPKEVITHKKEIVLEQTKSKKGLAEVYEDMYLQKKSAVPDIKIVSNLPAITVEEVAPTSYSDIALLAPEEVKKRTGVIKGQTERTETDRKRERRKKKVHQKIKQKKEESKNSDEKPLSRKAKKQEKLNILKKLKQNRNTKIANMEDEKIKSSKDFFERLQETVATNVSRKELMLKMKKKK